MNIEDAAPPIPWHEGFPVTAGHMRLGLTESSPETREFLLKAAEEEGAAETPAVDEQVAKGKGAARREGRRGGGK